MNRDDGDPVESVNNWPAHAHQAENPKTKAGRLPRALYTLRLLLLALAVLAAVLSFAAALARLAKP
ncbi:hypothetical protein [Streptomyces spiramyceticus]|uniref:hypothetical protein n=1 Tax=Streptomyces spiramyceticus TaxID=299717 RepID=UPI00237AA958|nr:hypothetical protein [Streptomyces spiramyceticus]